MKFFSTHKKGFVLALSLLLSSIVLALAFGIFNILLKELILTSSARDSQIAFYAADSAIECGLYWDTHSDAGVDVYGTFATSTSAITANLGPFRSGVVDVNTGAVIPKPNLSCMGANVTNVSTASSTVTTGTTAFTVSLNTSPSVCADVVVTKTPGQAIETSIQANGYNRCDFDNTNTRKVQRSILVTY